MIDITYSGWLFLVFICLFGIIAMQVVILRRQEKLMRDNSVFAQVLQRISGDLPN